MSKSTVDTVLNGADLLNGLTNKFVVSPILNLGIAGFVFDIPKETRIDLKSESTDHFAEDNSAIQDHIALRPIIITTGGFIGELKYEQEDPKTPIQELSEKLITINSYIPVLTGAARSLKSAIQTANAEKLSLETLGAATNSAVDIFGAYQALNPPDTEQAKAFNFFRAIRDARQLVAIDTPYGFFNNLVVDTITAIQPQESESITDFNITLKQFRTVQTQFVELDFKEFQGRGSNQRSEQQDQGKAQGKEEPLESFLSKSAGKLTGALGGLF
jgi:hypothetical protein